MNLFDILRDGLSTRSRTVGVKPDPAANTGKVMLTPLSNPDGAVVVELYEKVPERSGGTAKWEPVEHPRGRDRTSFKGESLITQKIQVLLDAWPTGDVENAYRGLMGWTSIMSGKDGKEPTKVRVSGPIPYPDVTYVINSIEEESEPREYVNGKMARCVLTIELLEYVSPSLITNQRPDPAAAANASSGAKPVVRTYTVKRGDSLGSIASRQLGNASRWEEIAKLNNVIDPRLVRAGQVLRLP